MPTEIIYINNFNKLRHLVCIHTTVRMNGMFFNRISIPHITLSKKKIRKIRS